MRLFPERQQIVHVHVDTLLAPQSFRADTIAFYDHSLVKFKNVRRPFNSTYRWRKSLFLGAFFFLGAQYRTWPNGIRGSAARNNKTSD